MKKQHNIMILIMLAMMIAACNRTPLPTATPTLAPTVRPTATFTEVPPTATFEPTETTAPAPEIIRADNASNLNISSTLELPFEPSGIVWSGDGQTLTVMGYKEVAVVAAADLSIINQITFPESESLLDFSSDGKSLATTNDFQTIIITDVISGQEIQRITTGVRVAAASFSPDGRQILIPSGEEWAGMIYDVASGELLETVTGFETAAPIYTIRFGADGKSVIWLARGSIQVEQIATQELGADIGHEDFITSFELSHSGSVLATAAAGTRNGEFKPLAFLWDPTSGEKLAEFEPPQSAYCLAFSPDDTLLAACSADEILLWDTGSQTLLLSKSAHPGGVWSARFSHDGTILATVGSDRLLHLWTAQ